MVNMTEIRREGEDMPPSHRHRIITTRQLQCGLYACSWDEQVSNGSTALAKDTIKPCTESQLRRPSVRLISSPPRSS
ncbi:unnamed protein product [Brassica oleracea]